MGLVFSSPGYADQKGKGIFPADNKGGESTSKHQVSEVEKLQWRSRSRSLDW